MSVVRLKWFRLKFIALVLCAFCVSASAAFADVVVVSSDVADYKRGQTLTDADVLKVPAGGRVMLLLSTNAVREIKGPFESKITDLSQGRPSMSSSLWQFVTGFFQTGGKTDLPGAVRAVVAGGPHEEVEPDAWRAIPLDISNAACAIEGNEIKISREDAAAPMEIALASVSQNLSAPLSFAAGARTTAWPEAMPVAAGGYMITSPLGLRKFELKLIPADKMQGDWVLSYLQSAGCEAQAKLWLQGAEKGK